MKIRLAVSIALAVALVAASDVTAATFYIDPIAGDDTNTGLSPVEAWKSLEKVNATTLPSGSVVLLRRGQVFLDSTIAPANSGTAGDPIVFSAYGSGDRPVVSGARSSSTEGLTWSLSSLSAGSAQIYYLTDGGADPGFTDEDAVSSSWRVFDESTGDDLEGYFCDGGTNDGDLCFPNAVGTAFGPCDGSAECVRVDLNNMADEQWAFGDADGLGFETIYFRSDSGAPGSILVPQQKFALSITGQSWLTFADIVFERSARDVIHFAGSQPTNSTGFVFENVEAAYAGANGMRHRGVDIDGFDLDIKLLDSRFHDNATSGASIQGVFHDWPTEGILASTNVGVLVDGCEFDNNETVGLYLFWIQNSAVRNSVMRDNVLNKGIVLDGHGYDSDGSGKEDLGVGSSFNEIHHNTIYNNGRNGILLEWFAIGNDIHHNLLYNNGAGIGANLGSANNVVRYNLIVSTPESPGFNADSISTAFPGDGPLPGTGNVFVHNTIDRVGLVNFGRSVRMANPDDAVIRNNVAVRARWWAVALDSAGSNTDMNYNFWNAIDKFKIGEPAPIGLAEMTSTYGYGAQSQCFNCNGTYDLTQFVFANPGQPFYDYTPFEGSPIGFAEPVVSPIHGVDIYGDGDFLGRPVDPLNPTQGAFEQQSGAPQEASDSGDLAAARGSGTSVSISYTPADCATGHSVYAGDLDTLATGGVAWTLSACEVSADGTVDFDPGNDDSIYFVVVGHNTSMEGSYGQGTFDERPAAEEPGGCGFLQDLAATCD